jgi:hypothetical protein
MVEWPGRGNRGKGSQEKRNADKLKRSSSMTAVAMEAGKFRQDFDFVESYNKDTNKIERRYINDQSLTKQQHLRLFDKRGGLLLKGDPFAMPTDIKRETSRSKRITLDTDTERYNKFPQRIAARRIPSK